MNWWAQFILTETLAVLSTLSEAGVIPPAILRVLNAIDAALDAVLEPPVPPVPPVQTPTPPAPPAA